MMSGPASFQAFYLTTHIDFEGDEGVKGSLVDTYWEFLDTCWSHTPENTKDYLIPNALVC
jgi:hypothetical protein